MKLTQGARALSACDQIMVKVESSVCDQCQDVCWSAELLVQGDLGGGVWATPALWVTHLSQSQCMRLTGATLIKLTREVEEFERQRDLIERQTMLFE